MSKIYSKTIKEKQMKRIKSIIKNARQAISKAWQDQRPSLIIEDYEYYLF